MLPGFSSTISFTHEASSWGSRRCTFFAVPSDEFAHSFQRTNRSFSTPWYFSRNPQNVRDSTALFRVVKFDSRPRPGDSQFERPAKSLFPAAVQT